MAISNSVPTWSSHFKIQNWSSNLLFLTSFTPSVIPADAVTNSSLYNWKGALACLTTIVQRCSQMAQHGSVKVLSINSVWQRKGALNQYSTTAQRSRLQAAPAPGWQKRNARQDTFWKNAFAEMAGRTLLQIFQISAFFFKLSKLGSPSLSSSRTRGPLSCRTEPFESTFPLSYRAIWDHHSAVVQSSAISTNHGVTENTEKHGVCLKIVTW